MKLSVISTESSYIIYKKGRSIRIRIETDLNDTKKRGLNYIKKEDPLE